MARNVGCAVASSFGDLPPDCKCDTPFGDHGCLVPGHGTYPLDLTVSPTVVLGEGVVFEESCTCTVSVITLRRERADDCPIHPRKRVTYGSLAWERIPEQTLCICAHPKAIHTYTWTCSAPGGCRCPDFHDVDHPMPLTAFMDRLLHEVPKIRPIPRQSACRFSERGSPSRARLALGWAWKQSGLALTEPRTWAVWMHESKRAWRAWRAAGSPITAFGKQTSFGVASIPALEDR